MAIAVGMTAAGDIILDPLVKVFGLEALAGLPAVLYLADYPVGLAG